MIAHLSEGIPSVYKLKNIKGNQNIHSLSFFHLCAHSVLPWALESWAEYDIKVFAKEGDLEKYANSEHALCVLNHRGDLDWMIGWVLIERIGMLGVSLVIIVSIL